MSGAVMTFCMCFGGIPYGDGYGGMAFTVI